MDDRTFGPAREFLKSAVVGGAAARYTVQPAPRQVAAQSNTSAPAAGYTFFHAG